MRDDLPGGEAGQLAHEAAQTRHMWRGGRGADKWPWNQKAVASGPASVGWGAGGRPPTEAQKAARRSAEGIGEGSRSLLLTESPPASRGWGPLG
jgi:hypothetical protein